MFSRRKPDPSKRRHDLSQFGLTDIPKDFDMRGDYDDDGDSDLEAELNAIVGGQGKSKANPKRKPTILPASELNKIIAESLKDVDSGDDDDDVENDADLMGELQDITGNIEEENDEKIDDGDQEKSCDVVLPTTTLNTIDVIQKRIDTYKKAESHAKAIGEGAKARRYGRGLKTLIDTLQQAKSGKNIILDELPPEISLKNIPNLTDEEKSASGEPPLVPMRPAPSPPVAVASDLAPPETTAEAEVKGEPESEFDVPAQTSESPEKGDDIVKQMKARQREYKEAALKAKRSGDTATALQFLKVVKQFDIVMQMQASGQEVDLSDMPPSPEQFMEFMAKMQAGSEEEPAQAAITPPSEPVPEPTQIHIPVPTTLLEALQQRLDKYKSVEESAKAEGNASKARRFGRIVKQYEDAIKAHKSGREVPYDELPVPPGYGPLPTEASSSTQPQPKPKPQLETTVITNTPQASTSSDDVNSKVSPKHDLTTRTTGNQHKNNIAEQQMKILLERQKEFKIAALEAKKAGEIEQAKEYLKIFKGFEALLNAASSGLPVDLSTLPVPPSQRESLEASFAIVSKDECDPDVDEDISDIVVRVEEQLAKQLMMCKNTRDHHKAMGDIAGMNRFENLALSVQKDLDLVRYSKRKGFPLPKFHYEKRSFNIVHCNTDLTDNEMEIMVVRGINYNVPNPKDVDTYVKIECPLLNDETFRAKTTLIKDTDSPEYNQRFTMDIVRGNRQFQRIFKRHGVKFEVYSRGGFLRSDTLIGTVTVKLQPLETKCDIHDTYNLMDGRRPVGGKLEIKVRVRNPILTKQIENVNEKWLVLDAQH